jgi:hypothetical protein
MSFLIVLLFLQDPVLDERPPEPGPRSGLEVNVIGLHLDDAIGSKDRYTMGFEAAFYMLKPEPKYSIGLRAFYRRWEVTFDEFEGLPADLDGDVQQLGLDLVVLYPLTGPLFLGVELGGGGLRLEHDLEEEDSFFFEGGAFLRCDLFAGLYVEAGGHAFTAFTEFGGQDDDTDHVSFTARAGVGLELEF